MSIFGNKEKKTIRVPIELLVLSDQSLFIVTEAYKAARTNLMFMVANNDKKIIAFTSPNMAEGKTITSVNTAITFAQTGSRTLIIDADMRKPRIHSTLRIQSSPGLSDKLGGFSNESCIYETEYANLFSMPAGTLPPNPSELLGSKAMQELLVKLSGEFEYIFIDCPPIEFVTDAATLSPFISGIVVVVRHRVATHETVGNTITALKQSGANVLGFMLNGVPQDRRSYKYGYGYGDSYGDLEEDR